MLKSYTSTNQQEVDCLRHYSLTAVQESVHVHPHPAKLATNSQILHTEGERGIARLEGGDRERAAKQTRVITTSKKPSLHPRGLKLY